MPVNIAISGKICSGKTTTAQLISEHWGHAPITIAEPMYDLADYIRANEPALVFSTIFGLSCGDYTRATKMIRLLTECAATFKDEIFSGEKPRGFLQALGTAFKELDEDIWIRPVGEEALVHPERSYVCDDVRYPNEAKWLEECNFRSIRCVPPENIRMMRIEQLYPSLSEEKLSHISETALDNYPHFDLLLDTTLPNYKIMKQLETLLGPPLY